MKVELFRTATFLEILGGEDVLGRHGDVLLRPLLYVPDILQKGTRLHRKYNPNLIPLYFKPNHEKLNAKNAEAKIKEKTHQPDTAPPTTQKLRKQITLDPSQEIQQRLREEVEPQIELPQHPLNSQPTLP